MHATVESNLTFSRPLINHLKICVHCNNEIFAGYILLKHPAFLGYAIHFFLFICSPILEVSLLLAEMVQHGLRSIAFCKTRKLCELVLSYTYVNFSVLICFWLRGLF